jgi:DNA gyrase subunit A
MAVKDLRVMGRATQGVKLINLKGNDSIAAVAKVMQDDENVEDIEGAEIIENSDVPDDGTTLDNNLDDNNTEN